MYEKSQVTITQILDSAQQLFVNKSYDDITMAEIARESNVTKGAIYHHFASKENLFLQMMVRYLNSVQMLLRQAVDEERGARERLTQLTAAYLEQSLEDQRVIQLVRRDANRFTNKTKHTLVTSYQEALPNQIEAIIIDGIADDQIMSGDAQLMAWQFVAIVEVCLSDYIREKFESPQAMAFYLTSMFFDGVGK